MQGRGQRTASKLDGVREPVSDWFEDQRELDESSHHEAPVMMQRRRRRIDRERLRAREQLLERDLRFDAREGRADAQVDAPSEANVLTRVGPVEVDLIRVGE